MQKVIEEIHYAIGDSSLGPILIAQSGQGICSLFLGGIASDLQKRFPNATLTQGKARKGLASVIAWIENLSQNLDGRKNGAISGYRWGVERKKKLLQIEAAKMSCE